MILIGPHGLSLFHNQTIRQAEASVGRVVWALSAWKLEKKSKNTEIISSASRIYQHRTQPYSSHIAILLIST